MVFLYRFFLALYGTALNCVSPFNRKARLFIQGRREQKARLQAMASIDESRVWFHFPSLGEFEQGRPLLERWKMAFPEDKLIISFFSPSGYEVRKKYPLADYVLYLPLDSARRSLQFIQQVKPRLVIFTKYDLWYFYFKHLHHLHIPLYVIAAIFRPNQVYFKWYASFFRKILRKVRIFFVQDQESIKLLGAIGINQVIEAGDTRFDRVLELAEKRTCVTKIEEFCKNSSVFIAGSTWPADERAILSLINDTSSSAWKFIIVPHEPEVSALRINKMFPASVLYSAWIGMDNQHPSYDKARVLVIDNVGMLSSLYAYGRVAYIGGGFGKGIHNILEAGVFGLPLIFGPHFQKFKEARDLVRKGGAFPIEDSEGLISAFKALLQEPFRAAAGAIAAHYIREHAGATNRILEGLTRR